MPAGVVSQTTLRLPAADLGPESPLRPSPACSGFDPSSSPDLPPDMRERIAYGRLGNPLPYPLQNDYRRDLRPQELPAIKLTNSSLEAIVLPELGGRLWSLRDLEADRDLVFTNRRLQFANFGLTDAWFAGGVEWNLGSTGHSATTSRPVFVGSVPSRRGTAMRIWDWERTRDLVFSVDLLMPADRRLLLAFVRVRNPDPEAKPLYWWTNIAAAEEPGVRVLAPAVRAWRTGYDGSITSVDIPYADDPATDVSYPLLSRRAADYFFQVPPERRPWIAAVQADGGGLVKPRPLSCAAASCFSGAQLPEAGTGRSGCAGRAVATSRSRPVWPRPNSSTFGWREALRSAGRRPTRRSKRRPRPYTVLGPTRSPRSPSWWPGRCRTRRSRNGISGGEPRWPMRRRSRWRPAPARAKRNSSCAAKIPKGCRAPVRPPHVGRLPPAGRTGSHRPGPPGRRRCGRSGATDL